ncbi:HutD family protein [Hydrogenophaga taeniospiralis]|uniref:HutD/Ves family protein n=1 Tax=Hydrogenophaga taeniospiralis TaxID=65656 RepID=UPI001CFBE5BF|nr:HutD family protein [Hydrogenophaga taeniospiralis]UCU92354.1 HutD family protein [Hydrogenophaga taeniospiralis]
MTNVHRFRRADLLAQPWKNGGGLTREIVSWPPGSGVTDFDWRVSIAHIASSGPFSAFPGVDRVITLLEGAGVALHSVDGTVNHRLDQPLQPFGFAGELKMQAGLLGADCHDFNVMARRSACSASVRVLSSAAHLPQQSHGLLLACRGQWNANGHVLSAEEGLWWHEEPCAWALTAQDEDATMIAVLIQLLR